MLLEVEETVCRAELVIPLFLALWMGVSKMKEDYVSLRKIAEDYGPLGLTRTWDMVPLDRGSLSLAGWKGVG